MLSWYFVSKATYDAAKTAGTLTNEMLCFLEDTGEIYRGTQKFSEACALVESWPSKGIAMGKLYIDSNTLEGRIWDGSKWTTVIHPVAATIDSSDITKAVTGKAVAEYVAKEIEKVTGSDDIVTGVAYIADTNTLNVTTGDGKTQALPMTNVAATMNYDPSTGKLELLNAQGTALGDAINLDLERFVSGAEYDKDSRKIILSFNDDSDDLEIPVGDLVDIYTADEDSKGVSLTVTGNKFKAEAIVSEEDGNMLALTDKGLYVTATDISGKVDKVNNATAGNIATLTADGGIQDSGMVFGGVALASETNANTLATEAAVETYIVGVRRALEGSIEGKMTKVSPEASGQVIRASSTGDAEASGYIIGGEVIDGSANKLATEKAVQNYAVGKVDIVGSAEFSAQADAASDSKVTSEKAVVDALTWKTSF